MQKRNKIFWSTGLEITPDTFIHADNYICSQHNLIRRLIADKCHGLLPTFHGEMETRRGEPMCSPNNEPMYSPNGTSMYSPDGDTGTRSFTIKAIVNNRDISIEQLVCSGTTGAGYMIEIENRILASLPQKHLSIPDSAAKALYIVLRINPFEQILIEPVVNEEAPAAHSFYELHIRELDRIGEDELAILKIDNGSHSPVIDQAYIPPCMSVDACAKFLETYGLVKKLMTEIRSHTKHKGELQGAASYPLRMLYDEFDELSTATPPGALIRLIKKIMAAWRFFIPELRHVDSPDLLRIYNHNDVSITFKALLSYLQNAARILSQGEEDFTPQI
jgi:hypothetical protein